MTPVRRLHLWECPSHGVVEPAHVGGARRCPRTILLDGISPDEKYKSECLLPVSPVEGAWRGLPDPGVTDAAVEAACFAMFGHGFSEFDEDVANDARRDMRMALAAAATILDAARAAREEESGDA